MRAISYLIPIIGMLYFANDAKKKTLTIQDLALILALNIVSTSMFTLTVVATWMLLWH